MRWQAQTEWEEEGLLQLLHFSSGGESVTCSLTGTYSDKRLHNEGATRARGEQGWSETLEGMRSITATWLPGSQFQHLRRQTEHPAYQGDRGRREERAAEIMRGAVSSGVFPIFGNSSSSSSGGSWSFGSPDSSRYNWSCSKSRSSDSKAIYSSRDEESIYSLGIRGTSCPCSHSVDCTCSQSSDSCNAGAKVIPAVQFSVVVVAAGGSSGSGHWMTSVADEGHLDQLAETSQRRSSQELRCRRKEIFWCLCPES